MGEAEEGAVGDLGELGADGSIDRRLPVAVDVDPEGGDAVEVAPPICIDEGAPLAALDDRVALPQPLLHLGERVPDVSFVVLPEPMAAGGHCPEPPSPLSSPPVGEGEGGGGRACHFD